MLRSGPEKSRESRTHTGSYAFVRTASAPPELSRVTRNLATLASFWQRATRKRSKVHLRYCVPRMRPALGTSLRDKLALTCTWNHRTHWL